MVDLPSAIRIRRTATPNNPPVGLAPGQLSVEMASDPPKLWAGVPASVNINRRRRIGSPEMRMPTGIILVSEPLSAITPTLRLSIPGFIKHDCKFWWRGQIVNNGVFASTNVFVNGARGNLAPNRFYYLFLSEVDDAPGVLSPHFLEPAIGTHGPSIKLGNEGVEVFKTLAGYLADNHTLIGMVRTWSDGSFCDMHNWRFVRSWYGVRPVPTWGTTSELNFSHTGTWANLANYTEFLIWEHEPIMVRAIGWMMTVLGYPAGPAYVNLMLDNSPMVEIANQSYGYSYPNAPVPHWATWCGYLSEGYHFFSSGIMNAGPGFISTVSSQIIAQMGGKELP